MSFPTDFDVKERVRTATDIVDVIGRDLELRPQGRHFVARCPFHNDTRPSMNVNQERQSWKCWVCDIGGDVFSFVMRREGVDFPTALRMLAERAGIEIPEFRRGPKAEPGSPKDKATLLKAVKLVCDAYYQQLASDKSTDAELAREYLASRGVGDESRKRFRIGFAPDSWDFATNLLRKEGLSKAVAQACGVAIGREGQSGCYDRFRGRLMFPINNAQGQTISMGGRIIPAIADRIAAAKGDSSSAGAKYINGPETLLFRKSNELYGLDLARDAIRKADEVLVMEGYTDVIAAQIAGIDRAVAVLGTALTESHVRILNRFVSRVVLVLDGDEAGRRRAEEVLELFVKADVDLRILTLPDGADPADFLAANSADAMLDLASKSPDAIDHKLARLTENVDLTRDTHKVTEAIETMLGMFVKVPQSDDKAALKVDQLLLRMSQTFGLPAERLQRRLTALRETQKERDAKKQRYQSAKPANSPRRPVSNQPSTGDPFADAAMEDAAMFGIDDSFVPNQASAPRVESNAGLSGIDRELFETLLESPEVAAMAIESIDPDWLYGNTAKMLLSAYQDLDLAGHELTADSLLVLLENDFLKNQVVTLQERIEQRGDRIAMQPQDRYTAILTRYHEREFEAEKSRQIQKLKAATMPEDEELAVLEQLFEAERIRHAPR